MNWENQWSRDKHELKSSTKHEVIANSYNWVWATNYQVVCSDLRIKSGKNKTQRTGNVEKIKLSNNLDVSTIHKSENILKGKII